MSPWMSTEREIQVASRVLSVFSVAPPQPATNSARLRPLLGPFAYLANCMCKDHLRTLVDVVAARGILASDSILLPTHVIASLMSVP